jgi:hypothetical protein
VGVSIIPEERGVESLARQIRLTGRAYPLFDIAALILKRPDRYHIKFNVIKKADGKEAQPLFVCGLDDTLWPSEHEAIEHVFSKHFSTFYQTEKIPSDPPKGTYTFVAQCGISGTVLGPPNYHDYQNKLRKLHSEKFSRMPFEMFKSRIKIVREEAVVKKWLEDQSWKTEYIALNIPETVKLGSREEVDRHFREIHLPNVVKQVEHFTLSGPAAMSLASRPLQSLARRAVDEQLRFPLKVVNALSQQFATQGLQFFKVNKTVTHVAVSRPRYLDLSATPVSDGIRKIVDFIEKNPNCNRRKLFEALAPSAPLQTAEPADPQAATPPSPEAAALVSDLHWLIHQGHVIEFANGILELAKKPFPRPAKAEKPTGEAAQTESTSAPASEASEAPVEEGSAPQNDAASATPETGEAPASPDNLPVADAGSENNSRESGSPAVAATTEPSNSSGTAAAPSAS